MFKLYLSHNKLYLQLTYSLAAHIKNLSPITLNDFCLKRYVI